MVLEVNKKENSITVVFENMQIDDLVQTQKSLLKMIRFYNWNDFALKAQEPVYDLCRLLENLLPSCEQMQNGLGNFKNPVELPEALSEAQTESLKQAFIIFNLPDAIKPELVKNNPVYQALKGI